VRARIHSQELTAARVDDLELPPTVVVKRDEPQAKANLQDRRRHKNRLVVRVLIQ